jgi:hypothetical protein
MVKDILGRNWNAVWQRICTLTGIKTDPYQIWEKALLDLDQKLPSSTLFFLWAGDYGPFDKGLSWKHPKYSSLAKQISNRFPTGLHPSYKTFNNPGLIQEEKIRLEGKIGKSIVQSRFHFLRFRLPESYQTLVRLGIQEDYSMGFHDISGFRAGTGNPFIWYDLRTEKPEKLTLFPFSLMDSMFRFHLKKEFPQFLQEVQAQWTLAKGLGFTLHILFHNEHFSWSGWEKAVEQTQSISR